MSNWATDFMGTKVVGNINVALVFGLLQFVSTFLIAFLYARYANSSSTRWPATSSSATTTRVTAGRPGDELGHPHRDPVPRRRAR